MLPWKRLPAVAMVVAMAMLPEDHLVPSIIELHVELLHESAAALEVLP